MIIFIQCPAVIMRYCKKSFLYVPGTTKIKTSSDVMSQSFFPVEAKNLEQDSYSKTWLY